MAGGLSVFWVGAGVRSFKTAARECKRLWLKKSAATHSFGLVLCASL